MRLALILALVPALALAEPRHEPLKPPIVVEVELPVVVAEALASVVATRHLAGDTNCTIQTLCRDILAAQAEKIAQDAVAAEVARRQATQQPALRAWKRRVAELADRAEQTERKQP
jgi:hypothetical protein